MIHHQTYLHDAIWVSYITAAELWENYHPKPGKEANLLIINASHSSNEVMCLNVLR